MFTPHHVASVMCHMAHVKCHVSHVRCQVSGVKRPFLCDKVVELVGRGSGINEAYPKTANSCSCIWTTGMKLWLRQSAPAYLVLANIWLKPEPLPQTCTLYCILALAKAAPHNWGNLCPQVCGAAPPDLYLLLFFSP